MTDSSIFNLFDQQHKLLSLWPLLHHITIIEYDGEDVRASDHLHQYISSRELSVEAIDRVIVCGKKTTAVENNVKRLGEFFPSSKIETTNKHWQETNFKALEIYAPLVFHMATNVDEWYYEEDCLSDIVSEVSYAYYICVLSHHKDNLQSLFCLKTRYDLVAFNYTKKVEPVPTAFCKDRSDYMQMCQDTLIDRDVFFQCMNEVEQGCKTCDLSARYKGKRCPMAQRKIAEFYRNGLFVPQSPIIAHQWERLAAQQKYKPAQIQVADDLLNGAGCKQSIPKALDIYKEYAYQHDDYCIKQIIKWSEGQDEKQQIDALPFIVLLAEAGDEAMLTKLVRAFQNGDYWLPKDPAQEEKWVEKGAENDIPLFVEEMAVRCEKNKAWEKALRWYKHLGEISPERLPKDKLDEIEMLMMTNCANNDELALKGMDYLYGYHGAKRDPKLALRCLTVASKNGSQLAKGLLGQMYSDGIGVEEDSVKGINMLWSAAEKGDLLSLYRIWEDDLEKVKDQMMEAVELGIKANNPIAYYINGLLYKFGHLYEQSDDTAFLMMKKAADSGYPPAQYQLARMFLDKSNIDLYRKWLEISANNGYFEAEGKYGVRLFNVRSCESFRFLFNAIDKGYEGSDAYWCLAQCYMDGIGVSKDEEKAWPMYIEEAGRGNVDAQVALCKYYFREKKDYKQSAYWGEKAISQGRKDVRFEVAYSSSEIGGYERAKQLYLELANEGNGTAMNNYACELSDEAEKAEWYQKAADAGNNYGMWNLGRCYRDGKGVEKDIDKALELLRKSANLGCEGAMKSLAWMYRFGRGVEADKDEAIKWYRLAIEKGFHRNLLPLAEVLFEVNNVDEAIKCYEQAAEKGIEEALIKLGDVYERGVGVDKNIHKAVFWYRKAAAAGNDEAKESLKRLGVNWLADGKLEDDVNLPL